MHESAIVESMLRVVLKHAQAADAARVTGVNLTLGPFTDESAEAIQYYWDTLSEGTLADGAVLRFDQEPIEMQCGDCGLVFSPADHPADCPACLSRRVNPVHGDRVRVDSIEVD